MKSVLVDLRNEEFVAYELKAQFSFFHGFHHTRDIYMFLHLKQNKSVIDQTIITLQENRTWSYLQGMDGV